MVASGKNVGDWLFNEWREKSSADKVYLSSPAIEKSDGGTPAA